MSSTLVIVESPGKIKKIQSFLGPDYKVVSSHGHIRDLAKKSFSETSGSGISDFTPNYEVTDDKKDLVKTLKAEAKKADMVLLASDEDREGEAIAWHLAEVLKLKPEKTRRIVFHEITKDALQQAIKNPRDIDMDIVNAQQARRVLDRIVGFELSPVLWRKIKPSLSAGRVQSVTARLVVDREKEIRQFTPEQYWRVNATFSTPAGSLFSAALSRRLDSRQQAEDFLNACQNALFKAAKVETKPVKRSPAPPFTTSTLQQEAARKLGFSVSQTMRIAQDLYEAGHITYMRTDSLNLSETAIRAISQTVTESFGKEYLHVRHYHTSSKGAQEAHEAIRPTYCERETIDGSEREQKLYKLIRARAIASQMADMLLDRTTVEIEISGRQEHFSAKGDVVRFEGYHRVYQEATDESSANMLPPIAVGDRLDANKITATERYTAHPPRYSEGSLVRKMEELGIGRPSTYATMISTIQQRQYVARGENPGEKTDFTILTLNPRTGTITAATDSETTGSDKGSLVPTDTGFVVNDFLAEYFPDIMDYNFTAQVEEKFDTIAQGKSQWQDAIGDFYQSFHPEVESALNMRLEHKVGERLLGTDPASGRPVSVKIGRFGPLVQIGDADGEEKPKFASLLKGQSIATITLEEALGLFDFPRVIGDFEDAEVSVAIGRFGPYVKHAGKFVSIPKEIAPEEVTLDQAVDLIVKKRADEANRELKTFDNEPDLKILNGRFGPYISFNKKNYKIPKTIADPAGLSLEQVKEIIASQPAPKAKRPARRK